MHWYFLMEAPGPPPCWEWGGWRAWPRWDWENTLAPLMGCGTSTEFVAGGDEEAADSGLAEGE